ncbi:MAG: TetR/AcrR family transcriptional regulator [Alphaproteobacteria bacterium]
MIVKKTTPTKGRPSSKEQILQATERVVIEKGAGNLTLDSVAEYAKISKGGLLYHFPNKEALLNAMVDRFVFAYRDIIEDKMSKIDDPKNRYLKALILGLEENNEELKAMATSVLMFAANNPNEVQRLRDYFSDEWQELKKQSENEDIAMLVKIACEGLALTQILGLSPLSGEEKIHFIDILNKIVDEHGNEKCGG